MPQEAIPIVYVTDADRAGRWYERLGFLRDGGEKRLANGGRVVSLARGHAHIYLVERAGHQPDDRIVVHVRHSHLDEVAQRLDAEIGEGPWGPQIEITDPEGNALRITEARD